MNFILPVYTHDYGLRTQAANTRVQLMILECRKVLAQGFPMEEVFNVIQPVVIGLCVEHPEIFSAAQRISEAIAADDGRKALWTLVFFIHLKEDLGV